MPRPDYFPLTPGHALRHAIRDAAGNGIIKFEVLSISKRGKVTTAKCRDTRSDGAPGKPIEYAILRKSDGIYTPFGKEFPLPPVSGKKWVRNTNQRCFIDTLNGTVEVLAGTFKGCLIVRWDIDEGSGGNGEFCYAPGIGLIHALSTASGDEFEMSLLNTPSAPRAGKDPTS